jgi:hypothetical protein
MVRTKRKDRPIGPIDIEPQHKKARQEKISTFHIKKRKQNNETHRETNISKKICSQIISNQGMVSYTPEYIQHLKDSYIKRSYLGEPNYKCEYRGAIFWYNERNQTESRRKRQIIYTNCCKNGKIKIPPYKDPPEFLSRLINDRQSRESKHFLQRIRQYNSLFSFTSMGANIIKDINKGEGPYIFRINGHIHHRIGSLLPDPGQPP